jgi:acyl-CoA synthetase (AMP-forming)/AMP-acid ligase II
VLHATTRPDVGIPDYSMHALALTALEARGDAIAFVDAATGATVSGRDAAALIQRVASGPVVIQPQFDLDELCRTVQVHRLTFAAVVPPSALWLARHPVLDHYELSSLRLLCVSAAPTDAELETACARRLGCLVTQPYGMTEAVPPITNATPWSRSTCSGSTSRDGRCWPTGRSARSTSYYSSSDETAEGQRAAAAIRDKVLSKLCKCLIAADQRPVTVRPPTDLQPRRRPRSGVNAERPPTPQRV